MALTTEHKEALAEGRRQSRSIDAYLRRLNESRPRRGRRRTAETIEKRLAAIDEALPKASLLKALALHSERDSLNSELRALQGDEGPSLELLEGEFCEVAKEYGERKGITYAAWTEAGVPADVLRKAQITK